MTSFHASVISLVHTSLHVYGNLGYRKHGKRQWKKKSNEPVP